jgi:hypothetical protein
LSNYGKGDLSGLVDTAGACLPVPVAASGICPVNSLHTANRGDMLIWRQHFRGKLSERVQLSGSYSIGMKQVACPR